MFRMRLKYTEMNKYEAEPEALLMLWNLHYRFGSSHLLKMLNAIERKKIEMLMMTMKIVSALH